MKTLLELYKDYLLPYAKDNPKKALLSCTGDLVLSGAITADEEYILDGDVAFHYNSMGREEFLESRISQLILTRPEADKTK